MKRTLLFITCMLASVALSAQDELAVGNIQNSGCLGRTRGEGAESIPTIVLSKEDSVLSVQLLNYESNCATIDFAVTPTISGGSGGEPCSVNISVVPNLTLLVTNCDCPFNVSFTVRYVEANSFYLSCWWFEGQVTLEEGKPLVLEDVWEEATVDGMKFSLRKAMGKALLTDGSTKEGEVHIPAELTHEGKTYSVTSISYDAFKDNKNMTKVFIPSTIENMDLRSDRKIIYNMFCGCTALQSIEVEEGNPVLCSVDGVLFNKDKTSLISYPAGAQQTSYTVAESVDSIEMSAFSYSQNLRTVTLSDNVTSLGGSAFCECKSLEEVRLPSGLKTLESYLFANSPCLKSVTIPNSVTSLGGNVFSGCTGIESVTIPNGVTSLGGNVFSGCTGLKSLNLPESVNHLGVSVFEGCKLKTLYIRGIIDSNCMHSNRFNGMNNKTILYVQPSQVERFKAIYNGSVYPLAGQADADTAYRPFVEDGKIWKAGDTTFGNPVHLVFYYYFYGDTIIGGKACKKMMRQIYVTPDYPDYDIVSQEPSHFYEGAWYEEDKKVYVYDSIEYRFKLMYDFSIDPSETLWIDNSSYLVGPMQTGGIKGFKGTYRYVRKSGSVYNIPWLEGVGGTDRPTTNVYPGYVDPAWLLLSCTVGDEVIYLNDNYKDDATPDEARKRRFDFTHTTKIKPKSPMRMVAEASEEPSLYGEYTDQLLGINLNPLDDDYLVRITSVTGRTVYEKAVNAGSIVGLNIDISSLTEGSYTVTVENSNESFTGKFETQTAGISLVPALTRAAGAIYNLQGQLLQQKPTKGVYIQDGKKYVVK